VESSLICRTSASVAESDLCSAYEKAPLGSPEDPTASRTRQTARLLFSLASGRLAGMNIATLHRNACLPLVCLIVVSTVLQLSVAIAEDDAPRLSAVEERLKKLESNIQDKSGFFGVAILYAVFCAMWAQNSGRNAWLWFFLGLFFNVITVFVLLYKNSADNKRRRALEMMRR
jgi:hypothetical protein